VSREVAPSVVSCSSAVASVSSMDAARLKLSAAAMRTITTMTGTSAAFMTGSS
jgi:hypothetical protein